MLVPGPSLLSNNGADSRSCAVAWVVPRESTCNTYLPACQSARMTRFGVDLVVCKLILLPVSVPNEVAWSNVPFFLRPQHGQALWFPPPFRISHTAGACRFATHVLAQKVFVLAHSHR